MTKTVYRISLRTKLIIALAALAMIPLFFVDLVTIKITEKAIKEIVFKKNRDLASTMANDVNGMFLEKIRLLKFSVANSDIKSMQAQRIIPVLNALTAHQPELLTAAVLSANGDLLARSDFERVKSRIDYHPTVQMPIKTSTTTISDIFVSQTTGKQVIEIAEPIRNADQKVCGLLVVRVALQRIIERIATTRIGYSGYAFIVDQYGNALMHPDNSRIGSTTDLANLASVKAAINHRSGSMEEEFQGGNRLVSYSYVPSTGWGLIIQQPIEEALEVTGTLMNANILIMIIILLAIAISVFLFARMISKPISLLIEKAQTVAAGDYSARVQVKSAGEIECLANAFNNMTKQLKNREDDLKKSQDMYSLIVDTSNEGIWVVDSDQRITFVNARMSQALGYPQEEIIGQKMEAFFFEEDISDHIEKIQARRQGKAEHYERRWKHRDGHAIWTTVSATPVFDKKNRFEGSFGMITDITIRKRAEDAIRESEERYCSIMEASPEPIVTYDMHGKVLYVNPAFTRVFGWTYEEVVGKRIDYVPEEALEETIKMLKRLNDGESHTGFLTQRYDKHRNIKDIEMSFGVWKDKSGKPVGSVVVLRDVTEQKKLHSQLRQAQKMESIGILAGGIAHDFNNILAAIIGYTELSLIQKDETKREGYLQKILQSANRAKDLVRQILSFSRSSEINKSIIHVTLIAKEVLKLIRATIPTTIEIFENLKAKNDRIHGESTQIHQIFMNLCTNAGHAMRQNRNGTLEITLENVELASETVVGHGRLSPGDYLKLSFADTGHGIPEKHIERIFDPYFTTKTKNEGTGLGLAIINSIIKDHGGAIDVTSQVNVGTRFDIFLPVVEKEDEQEEKTSLSDYAGDETILLVDDEKNLVDAYGELLKGLGYKVRGMNDSQKALEVFRETPHHFDIVLSDYTMPQMTGDLLAAELLEIRPDIPIILFSGYSDNLSVESITEGAIIAFADKPVDKNKLAKLIRQVLSEAMNSQA